MKVAITVWGNRISPVFDSARTLLIAEVEGDEIIDRRVERMDTTLFSRVLELLESLDVDVLICGALSMGTAALFDAIRIEVIPFLTGDAEEILSLYVDGEDLADFTMPGCPRRRCCRGRRCSPGQQRIGRYREN
ncbi:NifB/NifX family molybdenum-iron cluster-binding protein [Desulfomarina sp.]